MRKECRYYLDQREHLGRKNDLLHEMSVTGYGASDRNQGVIKHKPRHQPADEPQDEWCVFRALHPKPDGEYKIENGDCGKRLDHRPNRPAQSTHVTTLKIAQSHCVDHGAI